MFFCQIQNIYALDLTANPFELSKTEDQVQVAKWFKIKMPRVARVPRVSVPFRPRRIINYTAKLNVTNKVAQSQLSKAIPGAGQAKHIIPWKYRTHNTVQRAARGGFDFNGKMNGFRSTVKNYPKNYDNQVTKKLAAIEKITVAKKLSDKRVAILLRNHTKKLKINLIISNKKLENKKFFDKKIFADKIKLSSQNFSDKKTARNAFSGQLQKTANRFFRGADKNSKDFKASNLLNGSKRLEFFSPARNKGYGKRYIQDINKSGHVIREFKETIGPKGIIETKWIHGKL